MNLILVTAQVIGFIALGLAALKIMDSETLSVASRIVLLVIVFAAIYASLEALASHHASRPGATVLIFACGLYAMFRVFSPIGRGFLTRDAGFTWTPIPRI